MAFSGFVDRVTATPGDASPETSRATTDFILPHTLAGFTSTPKGWGEFLANLGAEEDTEVEVFLGLSTEDMLNALGVAVLDGATLPPIVKAGITVFIRKIFRAAGFNEPALGGSTPQAQSAPQPAPAAAPPPAPANFPPAPPAATEPDTDTVAWSGVVDQTSKLTAKLVTYDELFKLRAHYVEVCGRAPPDAHLPSAEQLSCLKALVAAGRVPYVDFAVWNSHGARLKHFARAEAAVFVGGRGFCDQNP